MPESTEEPTNKINIIKSLKISWPFLIFCVVNIAYQLIIMPSTEFFSSDFIAAFYKSILAGLLEEVIFRYWLQNKISQFLEKKNKNKIFAIFIASIIFGLIHLINIKDLGIDKTILQIISATFGGILFGSLYYKTNNISCTIILHILYDIGAYLSNIVDTSDIINYVSEIMLILFCALISFDLLKNDIINNKNQIKTFINSTAYRILFILLVVVLIVGIEFA